MALTFFHSNQAEMLRAMAVHLMRVDPPPPLSRDVILVQSNGMGDWLSMGLAADEGLGIAALLDITLPARFLWRAYRAVLGEERVPLQSPWDKALMTWRLFVRLGTLPQTPEYAPLHHYLADDGSKRYRLARRIADLFDQYQMFRADMLEAWERHENTVMDGRGQPHPLPAQHLWQPALWRDLLESLPEQERHTSRAHVHRAFLDAVAQGRRPHGPFPARITVFGLSSMPQQTLEALAALGRFCNVAVFVHNPCRYYWGDIMEGRELLKRHKRRHPVRPDLDGLSDDALHLKVPPLLAAWGKQGRDYIAMLAAIDDGAETPDTFIDPQSPSCPSVLHQLQQDILDLAAPRHETPLTWRDDDHSVLFTRAHSRQREVEILHDHLLSLFERYPDLQPRDIVVMVPNIDHYSPLIEAVFGSRTPRNPCHIPYTIADRAPRDQDQILRVLDRLIDPASLRMTPADLFEWLDVPAVRARFDIREDDLPRLERWIVDSGIRWGFDARHHQATGMAEGEGQNSWVFGLQRLLLGYLSGDQSWDGIVPCVRSGGLDAVLLGALYAAVDTLADIARIHSVATDAIAWRDRLEQLTGRLLLPRSAAERQRILDFRQSVTAWSQQCLAAGVTEPLPAPIVREDVMSAFKDSGLTQRFLAGAVNVCTLMPMRAVPFRIVCLLGMNDGDYPRQTNAAEFDLMSMYYRPGDRTGRDDDRYLFLEALLSARDQFYVSHVGFDARDNSPREASLLVGQLRDCIDAGWSAGDGASVSSRLTADYPLQPFSQRYFRPDRNARLFTYDRAWRDVLATQSVTPLPVLDDTPLPEHIEANVLVRFLRQPVDYFFRERLGVQFPSRADDLPDHEAFIPPAELARHTLLKRLIESAMTQAFDSKALEAAFVRLSASGELPIGPMKTLARQQLERDVTRFGSHWALACARWPTPEAPQVLRCTLGTVTLTARLANLHVGPDGRAAQLYLRPGNAMTGRGHEGGFKCHYFLEPWVDQLIGHAAGTSSMFDALVVTLDGLYRIPPLPADQAHRALTALLDGLRTGRNRPLPTEFDTALAWITEGRDAAGERYDGTEGQRAGAVERSPALQRCWPDFDALATEQAEPVAQALYGAFHQWLSGRERVS